MLTRENDTPDTVRGQLAALISSFRAILADNLIGIYLHGSLAMGCFNSRRSDVDLLVVNRRRMRPETKRAVVEVLLAHSGTPAPVEISFLTRRDLHPWRYPPPFDLHFSEDWREKLARELAAGVWKRWTTRRQRQTDPDLAAHITILRQRGRVLDGPPVESVFPVVPAADYRDAIVSDLDWASERLPADPVYAVLNASRVLRYLSGGVVTSKAEAAEWALSTIPADFRDAVAHALAAYRGESAAPIAIEAAERYLQYATHQVETAQRAVAVPIPQ
jgi:streptomycin 3"-adenylyltransferase